MIGLLTFHWADDYGAMLQAYALKRYLEKAGRSVEFIPYAPVKLTGRYWWCPLAASEQEGKLRYWPSRSGWKRNLALGGDFWKRKRAMCRFRRQRLAPPPKRGLKRISLEKYSCVFVGSDQVWNPVITVGLDSAYLGNLPGKESCRLVSYAASFGASALPAEAAGTFAEAVGKNFAAVSVRERRAAPFLSSLLRREVEDALDPVLLLEREEWERLGNRPAEEGYILVYSAEYNEPMLRYAQQLARRLQIKAVQISMPLRGKLPEGIELRVQGGPAEFVGYLQNAACVLTNSFHGTAFSVLLEKPFFAFRHSFLNARLEDLLEKLGLQARIRTEPPPLDSGELWEAVDWAGVRERLDAERARSGRFIQENLRERGEPS
ncbi:MAG: polysaccharide pyruvyl transferase family protein [Provencibacterium sp.]|jgi:hypothetical protein|nr:polysaccharide pyruvyl transferase family protein [Provencibacterium sp.]